MKDILALANDRQGRAVAKSFKTVKELKRLQAPLLLAQDLRAAAAAEPILVKRWAIQNTANEIEMAYLLAEREVKGK